MSLGGFEDPAGIGFAVGGEVEREAIGFAQGLEVGLPVVVAVDSLSELDGLAIDFLVELESERGF